MKTVENFLKTNPSYVKCSAERIATRCGVATSTVIKFRKTPVYNTIKNNYLA